MEKNKSARDINSQRQTERISFRACSYNIHRCVGLDGKYDPQRVAQVICELDAPIVGLQEVDSTTDGSQTDCLAAATGLTPLAGPAVHRGKGYYGNVLLTRYPILSSRCLQIGVRGLEPRTAIDVLLDIEGVAVRVVNTHLGLAAFERRGQVKRLLDIFCGENNKTVVVLGDINEWMPFNSRIRAMNLCLGKAPSPRTFPSLLPLVALDRIWARPRQALKSVRAHQTQLSKIASDHLPVVAEILLPSERKVPGGNGEAARPFIR